MKTNRRDFLRRAGLLGALPLTSKLAACDSDQGTGSAGATTDALGADGASDTGAAPDSTPDAPEPLPEYSYDGTPGPQDLFQHGVASGDPLRDAVILWTRVTRSAAEPVDVFWEVARDEGFSDRVAAGWTRAEGDRDFTVKVDATGLTAGARYHYRFQALGRVSPVGHTRTAAAPGTDHVRVAVCACASYGHGYFHAYREMAERHDDLDVVLHVGDYIYEQANGEYGDVRTNDPLHEVVSLADYRRRYAYYHEDPMLQAVHAAHPFVCVWDDHEFANNAYSAGASGHSDSDGPWETRKQHAARAYHEWLPIREQDPLLKIWRRFDLGGLVDVFMLDSRMWNRDRKLGSGDEALALDPQRQMLGPDQEAWLVDGLRSSTAAWRLIGQQVMMAPMLLTDGDDYVILNGDQWDGYMATRNRLLDVFAEVGDVVVVTGDIHTSWANDIPGPEYDAATQQGARAVEFVCTSITSPGGGDGLGPLVRTYNPHARWVEATKRGYVILDITPERVRGDWFHVEDVTTPEPQRELLAASWQVNRGEPWMVDAS